MMCPVRAVFNALTSREAEIFLMILEDPEGHPHASPALWAATSETIPHEAIEAHRAGECDCDAPLKVWP